LEQVLVDYKVQQINGVVTTSFGPGPACAVLDSCGQSGFLRDLIHGQGGVLRIKATRIVRRRIRASGALRDFRSGRLDVLPDVLGGKLVGSVLAIYHWPLGPACQDALAQQGLALAPYPAGRSFAISLAGSARTDLLTDPLRTRCPGPTIDDVNADADLAETDLPLSLIGARRLSLRLRAHGGFSAGGFSGKQSGAVSVDLKLTRIQAGTRRVDNFVPLS
jgi:hypothetical protein